MMENGGSQISLPLVVRVKRCADEEPLDVLRLCPLRKKLRSDSDLFTLQELKFKHAGTISEKENVTSRTADLILASQLQNSQKASGASGAVASVNKIDSTVLLPEKDGKRVESSQKIQQTFRVARKFRPIAAPENISPVVDQLEEGLVIGDIISLDHPYATSRSVASSKRPREDDAVGDVAQSESASSGSGFIMCDLETFNRNVPVNKKVRGKKSCITCNDEELVVETAADESEFVYDVYMLESAPEREIGTVLYDNVNACFVESDLVLGTWSENDLMDDPWFNGAHETKQDDDDDSNAEDNERCDYPDESDSASGKSDTDANSEGDDVNDYSESGNMFGLRHSMSNHQRKILNRLNSSSEEDDEDNDEND